ncbi:MAG TPA: DUF1707 domain-containing protein [Jiangellaceae bacterium]
MSSPEMRWRPSDADRERYAAVVADAYSQGRIDSADMESRTALLYEAASIADLDSLVDDLPGDAAPPRVAVVPPGTSARAARLIAGVVVAAAVAVGGVAVLGAQEAPDQSPDSAQAPADDSADDAAEDPADPADPADLPPIAEERLDTHTAEGLSQLWQSMADAGITEANSITVFGDGDVRLWVRAPGERRSIAEATARGGAISPLQPYRDLSDSDTDEATFFALDAVTSEAVAQAMAATPAAAGTPDAALGHTYIERDILPDYPVTITVNLEDGPSVVWDATGANVLDIR